MGLSEYEFDNRLVMSSKSEKQSPFDSAVFYLYIYYFFLFSAFYFALFCFSIQSCLGQGGVGVCVWGGYRLV